MRFDAGSSVDLDQRVDFADELAAAEDAVAEAEAALLEAASRAEVVQAPMSRLAYASGAVVRCLRLRLGTPATV